MHADIVQMCAFEPYSLQDAHIALVHGAAYKSVRVVLGGAVTIGFRQRVSPLPMAETSSAAADLRAPDDLISFLQAIPVGVSLLRRSWPIPAWGALSAVVPAVGGGDGGLERLPRLP